jgi:hypothetical protein
LTAPNVRESAEPFRGNAGALRLGSFLTEEAVEVDRIPLGFGKGSVGTSTSPLPRDGSETRSRRLEHGEPPRKERCAVRMNIELLADRPDAIPIVARWIHSQ